MELYAESARERQVIAISDFDSRQRRPLPTIIAGDLDAEPDSSSIRYLTGLLSLAGRRVHYHDAWAMFGVGPGYTWTVDNPNGVAVIDAVVRQPHHRRRIDYVLIGSAHAHPEGHCRIRDVNLAFNEPKTGSGPATTTASWWTSRSARTPDSDDDEDARRGGAGRCIPRRVREPRSRLGGERLNNVFRPTAKGSFRRAAVLTGLAPMACAVATDRQIRCRDGHKDWSSG